MVAIEIGLYFFIILLIVYFLFIKKPHYEKHSRIYKDLKERKEQSRQQFRIIKQKPMWQKKAHYGFLVFLFIFIFLFLSILLTYLWNILKTRFVLSDTESVYFNFTWGISFLVFAMISLPLTNLILESFPFKTARYMQSHHYGVPTFSHGMDMKLTLLMFLIIFVIGFPFVIFSTDCYSRVTKNQFSINGFFGFEETNFRIPQDIDHIEIDLSLDRNCNFYYYVLMKDRTKIEVLDENLWDSKNVVYLNNIMEENNIPIKRKTVMPYFWEDIENRCYDDTVSSLKQLYHID